MYSRKELTKILNCYNDNNYWIKIEANGIEFNNFGFFSYTRGIKVEYTDFHLLDGCICFVQYVGEYWNTSKRSTVKNNNIYYIPIESIKCIYISKTEEINDHLSGIHYDKHYKVLYDKIIELKNTIKI